MPKRRRFFTPLKNKTKFNILKSESDIKDEPGVSNDSTLSLKEISSARGRFQGVLMDVLEPPAEESQSESSSEETPLSNEGQDKTEESDDEDSQQSRYIVQRQSYVLKLFDRSVDLSQFDEDTPLYPICRAWIANQPRADYSAFGKKHMEPEINLSGSIVELPGPDGPPVPRIPELLPEQLNVSKDIINQMHQTPPPSKEQLLQGHMRRWLAVRQAWLDQGYRVEDRYDSTQDCLNKIALNGM
ncbi:hypothetical protein K1T71_007572 [Dendrolimus kikuchii]|uniref:Uncharacterized protein n=1 Tax=Dendrolimus kikuchii TaxID=765133 RepID=A0ACC1CXM3_9NEOP|nr:hypothetical protein K1T71_007572 [Dendrolimus kikuchii]